VLDISLWAVPFGIVGDRLYHVVTDPELYFAAGKQPIKTLYIWDGGLGIWGVVALGAVGAWIVCRRRGVGLSAFADAVAPGLVLAQAIGRFGNYFNQEPVRFVRRRVHRRPGLDRGTAGRPCQSHSGAAPEHLDLDRHLRCRSRLPGAGKRRPERVTSESSAASEPTDSDDERSATG